MAKALLNGSVIAESDETVVVEGNHYFPPSSVRWDYLAGTDRTSVCGWKGTASYYSVTVGAETVENVAWTYHEPMEGAAQIKDHVAFYPQVTVEAS